MQARITEQKTTKKEGAIPPKRLILTALDDNHDFWYEQLIPFLISLEHTDYIGDIGVISYGLSDAKKAVLHQNGILVFEAPYRYAAIYIDRQWAVAEIAEKYHYDQIALYDCDIWFPSEKLTVFEQIKENEKLYCAYDVRYADFIDYSAISPTKEIIKPKIDAVLEKHKHLWQVGLLLGTKLAWRTYQDYLEQLLSNSDYVIGYGIDSLAAVLYSADTENLAPISIKYNCMPNCQGVRIDNLDNGKVLHKDVIRYNNEKVEGVHLITTYRAFDLSMYTYGFWNNNFYDEGRKYQLHKKESQKFIIGGLGDLWKKDAHFISLELAYLHSNDDPILSFAGDDTLITLGSTGMIMLKNNSCTPCVINIAFQSTFGYKKPKRVWVNCNNKPNFLSKYDDWLSFKIESGNYIKLISEDIDNEKVKATWRLQGVRLVE